MNFNFGSSIELVLNENFYIMSISSENWFEKNEEKKNQNL